LKSIKVDRRLQTRSTDHHLSNLQVIKLDIAALSPKDKDAPFLGKRASALAVLTKLAHDWMQIPVSPCSDIFATPNKSICRKSGCPFGCFF
jgi:hypothetical protein